MKDEDTEEDQALAASLDAADAMAARELIINAEDHTEFLSNSSTSGSSRWEKYKSKGARSVARRLLRRCQQIFASATKQCVDKFADVQSKCYAVAPWLLRSWICSQFNSADLCQPAKMRKTAIEKCKLDGDNNGKGILTPDLEDQWNAIDGITKELEDQMKINVSCSIFDISMYNIDIF